MGEEDKRKWLTMNSLSLGQVWTRDLEVDNLTLQYTNILFV